MRRALGRGLSQLMSSPPEKVSPTKEAAPEMAAVTPESGPEQAVVPIGSIVANRRQPRAKFRDEGLTELAASIQQYGVIQPLLVRLIGGGKYELIAGERRLRASKLAGLKEVPVIVRSTDGQTSLELALIENIQREDISAIECARAYVQLIQEFQLTQEQVADKVGKSRAAIANTMRLLRLPDEIQAGLLEGLVTEGQVRPLLTLDSEAKQIAVFRRILLEGLNARQVEKLLQKQPAEDSTKETKASDPHWNALERGLSTYFGARTSLARGKVGGKIMVEFQSDDELDRILDVLGFRLDP